MDEHRLALLQCASISQSKVSRLINKGKRCCFIIAHRSRLGMSAALLSDRIFGEASDSDLCDHVLAHRKFGDAWPDFFYRAGDFKARRKRQRRLELIFAGYDQEVG